MSIPLTNLTGAQSSSATIQRKPLTLNEGQMIHGQIKKLFPGQMAEVQIGNQQVIAKLEVPMKAGESYYFQVNSVQPELQLKIISGPTGAAEGKSVQLNKLMEAMQLPKTNEMRALLSFIIKNKIPMTREELLQGETLIKNSPPGTMNETLVTIQKMAELKLPFTESMFRSIIGVESKEGLHAIFVTLKSALLKDQSILPQNKLAISATLETLSKPFSEATSAALLGQSFTTLLNPSESAEARFATVQLLKNEGFLPNQASLANLPQIFATLLTDGTLEGVQVTASSVRSQQAAVALPIAQEVRMHLKKIASAPQASVSESIDKLKGIISVERGLHPEGKEALLSILNRPVSREGVTRFVQEFSQAFTKVIAESVLVSPFKTESGPSEQLLTLLGQNGQPQVVEKLSGLMHKAERSESPAIQRILQAAESVVATAIDGKAIKDAMQTIIRSLGLNYEAALLQNGADIGRLADSLKPQLIALMQDLSVSAAVRESAEVIVMRMNGPLLLSGENGVQHQLIMQVPLEFFGERIDATMQWNGRMKEDGKIDPDFARVLFYLELHSLEKTIIDMQVQNRIVTVTVFNADTTLESVGIPMQERLKEGLESNGYKLSGILFKKFEEDEKMINQQKTQVVLEGEGVDFRI